MDEHSSVGVAGGLGKIEELMKPHIELARINDLIVVAHTALSRIPHQQLDDDELKTLGHANDCLYALRNAMQTRMHFAAHMHEKSGKADQS